MWQKCQIRVSARDQGRSGQRSEVRSVSLVNRRGRVLDTARAGNPLIVRLSAVAGEVRAIAQDRAGNNSAAVVVKSDACRRRNR